MVECLPVFRISSDMFGKRCLHLGIEKAEAVVIAAKEKYDAALDELERLVAKRKELDDKKVLEAYHTGGKTADEIVAFIRSGDSLKEQPIVKHSRKKRL